MKTQVTYPNHPEKLPDEVFLGNLAAPLKVPVYLQELKTARLGNVAYDILGRMIEQSEMRPLFVNKSEAAKYGQIQQRRFARINRRQNPDEI